MRKPEPLDIQTQFLLFPVRASPSPGVAILRQRDLVISATIIINNAKYPRETEMTDGINCLGRD